MAKVLSTADDEVRFLIGDLIVEKMFLKHQNGELAAKVSALETMAARSKALRPEQSPDESGLGSGAG